MLDCFEGFSNRSDVDELVINNLSGCNCNNYKLNNKLKCSLIPDTTFYFAYSYLSTKFGVFLSKFKGDMHDS